MDVTVEREKPVNMKDLTAGKYTLHNAWSTPLALASQAGHIQKGGSLTRE